jgi:polysaccharide export outer membrane protein
VKVEGQVAHPSTLPYHEGMTVLDAIVAVGGLTQFEGGNRVARIVRVENGKETIIHVKLPDGLSRGENVLLKPGDVVAVP